MTEPLLDIDGLTVSFPGAPRPVVRDFSLRIARGQVVALVGESGSGKSVTVKAILRLIEFQGGRITAGQGWLHDGKGGRIDLFACSEPQMQKIRGNRIAMIFQEPMTSLNPVLTVGFQLREAVLRHQDVSRAEADRICLEALQQVRLSEPERRLTQYPHELSGGMRQRVMIAMALACKPDLLIADEPTTALDVTVQAEILALLRTIQAETGMAVLIITHDMGVVAEIAAHVQVMLHGDTIEHGPVQQVFDQPQQPYTRSLLDAAPKLGSAPPPPPRPPVAIPALEVCNLVLRYPVRRGLFGTHRANVHAVEDVSFAVAPGETLALVGESGCGKSSLARTILRLQTPQSGEIRLNGQNILGFDHTRMKAARRGIQMVFQDPYASLNPRKRVAEIIAEPLQIHGAGSAAEIRERVAALIARVGLPPEAAGRFPHEFSGGQRQRICIARAVALNPSVIIADEPVSALDVSIQASILDLIEEIQAEFNVAILFISHDMAVVEKVADRVAVMYQGELIEIGPRDAVLRTPAHAYTRQLLEAVPVPHPSLRRDRMPAPRQIVSPIHPVDAPPRGFVMEEVGPGHFLRRDKDS
ncbi:peptide/nickel transport system ATP-binding protein/glutathione transport system ATP-binding protein [Gemmobacter megaterium]|uniref:Glutathione import ATP-binding protein GsiA n=1 Tax=Gemmobacter megaterium TaxID=1086013 RepID=A0A1N7N726_9RHOB|nr:ABC transporter ATP-binding protein [Gemmobacter megaterium]GGE13397.1 ABC transporter ATP-binding protein [Gemmobacter megaterium]SIS94140.1 peptide/nickel transport system ATP-binding protein/glutathione transport system ATP-binding protein [Gemmobacter megaterium]